MRTVASPDQIAERRRLGLDTFDEIWAGEYRVNPAPRPRHEVILLALLRHLAPATASALVELLEFNLREPGDHRVPHAGYVDELPRETFVPTARIVTRVVSPHDSTYVDASTTLGTSADDIAAALPWERIGP